MSRHYRIGVMFSTTGPYSVVPRSMLNGALLAVREALPGLTVEPVVVNPGGDLAAYAALSRELLQSGIRHVVGCYTSSSRKEVIPCFEKHDALLWYPSHYEGFESSNNVIYTGASPNQHVLPLVDHMLAHVGPRAFCIGSNYIWAWENTRIFREAMTARGARVLAERYVAVGDTEIDQVVDAILEARPSFVFNNLIGTSNYAFFRAFRAACNARGIDQPRTFPVVSCTLSEPELEEIGEGAVEGHLSSSVYFSSLATPANRAFTRAYREAFPEGPSTSADAEASYIAMKLLMLALAEAGTDDVEAVKAAVTRQHLLAPQGEVRIDPQTLHAYLTPRIGISNGDARFDILVEAAGPVPPDPYLVQSSPRYAVASRNSTLRVVK
ncbi:transporter substrate-binding domain-containing protein [Ancylobacter amanitiformis]|uniref:Branched-chain amino acid transport system substrate-binding protein n=1 Tax=Ancylobacter amanitiformis TaxID=217069 RepID=A0ABU0LT24_9HYPH|nr:transporter substrate-binding domain-containing protein [Ancylobacter amanitiformis]MDQ0511846.1 branched-chain amino acid transport system substrate-binding protein [Ancylobacter amanitiformis]